MFTPLLEVQKPFRVAGARDFAPSQKSPRREGFVAFARMMAGIRHLKRIRGRHNTKDMFMRDVRKSGR